MSFKGKITDIEIPSLFLQSNSKINIYVPENFSSLNTYQLLIALDGDDYFQKGKIATKASLLLEKKEISNVIIVGVPYNDIDERYEKYHPNGKKHTAFIRFLAEELVPFLDRNYHTYQLAHGRILIGDSLAGTAVLHALFEYPYTFGKGIVQSPYIHHSTINELRQFSSPEMIKLYHVIGSKETEVTVSSGKTRDFLSPNRQFNKLCIEKGIDLFYDEFKGEHSWAFWQEDLNRALTNMLS